MRKRKHTEHVQYAHRYMKITNRTAFGLDFIFVGSSRKRDTSNGWDATGRLVLVAPI